MAVCVLFFGSIAQSSAQQAPTTIRFQPGDAQRGLNGHQHNFYFLPPGVTGENYVNAGFFGQKMRPFFGNNAGALANLNLYKRQKTQFLIDRALAVGAFGLYGQQIFGNGERQYFNSTQQIAVGVFAASLIATVFINTNTNSYMQRAVGSFNAERSQHKSWPRLRPSSLGVERFPMGQPLLAARWSVR